MDALLPMNKVGREPDCGRPVLQSAWRHLKSAIRHLRSGISNLRSEILDLGSATSDLKFEISDLRSAISNLKFVWWWLRQVSGDAAYENYARHAKRRERRAGCSRIDRTGAAAHVDDAAAGRRACSGSERDTSRENAPSAHGLLSREDFYLDALRRRYSGVSRCC